MVTQEFYTAAVERHLDMVYRIALNWFRNAVDAEDADQEVLLRLWRTDIVFANEDHLRHWLVRVSINICKDISRNPWRKRILPLESCLEASFSNPDHEALFQEVMRLPAKYRLPLYLYYYEGYSVAEVGELMKLNPSTVQTRLARAREKLKKQLEG